MNTEVNKLVNEANIEILVNKNPKKVIADLYELICSKYTDSDELKSVLAFAYFENRNYQEASDIYYKINKYYQSGFCELLMGNKDKARELWFSAQESPAVCWARCLIDLIEVRVGLIPSFLQIRNYLECDISYFITADKINYAENLIQCSEFLTDINAETNKFIGKALIHNGYPNLAVDFFLRSQELVPNDPEIFFYLALYTFEMGQLNESRRLLKQCLELNAYYTPAKFLLDKIGKNLISNASKSLNSDNSL